MTKKEALAAMAADLARSGLTMEDAARHRFRLVEPRQVERRYPKAGAIWAYEIPYPQKFRPRCPAVSRIRVLEGPHLPFGAVLAPGKRWPKYWQPEGTPPAAYIPDVQDVHVAIDGLGPLLLVEGEEKALKASLCEFPTIGLGGVWAWRSGKRGWQMLPELAAMKWAGREVFICFDSDAATNPDVARAIEKLLDELVQRQASVRVATVPEGEPGQKWGLDDFLVARGRDEWAHHMTLAPQADLAVKLWSFNRRFVYVEHPSVVVDEDQYDLRARREHKIFGDVSKFKTAMATQEALKITAGKGGVDVPEAVKVADEWIEWRGRRTCDALIYQPGGEHFVNGAGVRYNTWRGLGVEPAKGDVRPWHRLLDYLFRESPREHRLWFERWCGWPLKHLGAKMYSAACLWGKPARGKSVIAEKILGPIYGSNFISIGQSHLESDFNDWAVSKQLVLVDEVSATDSRERANAVKKLITQSELVVNEKFVPRYKLTDCINFIMTSNSPRAFHVEDNDRRYFIHRVPDEPMPRAFWDDLIDKWAPGGGRAALLYYFQHELDYAGFRPDAEPPVTDDKSEMVELCRHPAEDWLRTFVGSPLWKSRGGREVYTISELCALYRAASDKYMAPNVFGAHVTGAEMLKRIVRTGTSVVRLCALVNGDKWKRAAPSEWVAELHRLPGKKF